MGFKLNTIILRLIIISKKLRKCIIAQKKITNNKFNKNNTINSIKAKKMRKINIPKTGINLKISLNKIHIDI